jgi:endonuclease/exonuclease/phosphatase family metal-dependent hydrolase
MHSPELHPEIPQPFTIATWNILLDYTRTREGIIKSQADRLSSQIGTLDALRTKLGRELDAVAIQEAQKTAFQHNGEELACALGYGVGQWVEHNKKPFPKSKTGRKGEHVGLFGARIDHSELIELGDNRRAVLSHIGNVAIVSVHTRADMSGQLQPEQASVVVKHLEEYPHAVVTGDFNDGWGENVRPVMESNGYNSAFTIINKRRPKTWPARGYRKIMYGPAGQLITPALRHDDIYVRGVAVHDAGKFRGDSDHVGLWATIQEEQSS